MRPKKRPPTARTEIKFDTGWRRAIRLLRHYDALLIIIAVIVPIVGVLAMLAQRPWIAVAIVGAMFGIAALSFLLAWRSDLPERLELELAPSKRKKGAEGSKAAAGLPASAVWWAYGNPSNGPGTHSSGHDSGGGGGTDCSV
jgi:hypothetical protein